MYKNLAPFLDLILCWTVHVFSIQNVFLKKTIASKPPPLSLSFSESVLSLSLSLSLSQNLNTNYFLYFWAKKIYEDSSYMYHMGIKWRGKSLKYKW